MKRILLFALSSFTFNITFAQSAHIQRNMDDSYELERLDILNGRISDSLHTDLNGISIKDKVVFLESYLAQHQASMSSQEIKDIEKMISKSGEWATGGDGAQNSAHPILKSIYKKKSDFLNFHGKNYDIVLNPVIAYQQMMESGNTKQNLFINTKGLEVRGSINKRIGFYSIFTDNQERGPLQFQNYNTSHIAVQGATFFKNFKDDKPGNARDYIFAAGYLDADIIKNTLNVSFGHDRFQIGDGYRSLFLGDQGANYLFAKINTRLGRFNYQNLFMELTPTYLRAGDKLLPKKYATMHHLSFRAAKWLQIGLFETIVFSRKDHFDFQYMNPIILYRSIEQSNGSPDNAMMGMNIKINPGIKTVLYGQVMLDEFNFGEIKARDGWWANKFGIQAGFKIADLLNVKNLMIQGEINMVRPFTYSFRDSVANYTHYNQELAHIYGSNFIETALIVRYKPTSNLYLTWKSFYNKQGRDSSTTKPSYGGNIFKDYETRNAERGISLFNGFASEVLFTNLNASYEIRHNFYVDLGFTYRSELATTKSNPSFNSLQVYTGFRLNALRRQYDY